MTIAELARSEVITVPPEALATHIAELMEEESVGSVVVVDDDRPIGLVTDRDLAMEVVARGTEPSEVTAEEVMTPDPITVEKDAGIYGVLSLANDTDVRRIPVVDRDGGLAGIVTLDDFIVLLTSELDHISDIVQAESPPY